MTYMTTADMIRAETLAGTLLRLLRIKFRAVPEDTVTTVKSASASELETWTDRFVTAQSLEQIFSPEPGASETDGPGAAQ